MQKLEVTLLCMLFVYFASLISFVSASSSSIGHSNGLGDDPQPLSKIDIHKTVLALHSSASVEAYPTLLGLTVRLYNKYWRYY